MPCKTGYKKKAGAADRKAKRDKIAKEVSKKGVLGAMKKGKNK